MLTVKEIDNANPKDKPFKLADGEGLYLHVMPSGAKYWRMKYRIAGKEKLLSFGGYPEVRPPEARDKAKAAREKIRLGTAYNRTKFLKERKAMMQLWADYLDKIKAGAEVIPLHGNAA